jgi:hypothetical protein
MTTVQNVPAKFKSKEFTDRLVTAARKSQSVMPTADELKTTDKATKALVEKLSTFLQEILSTTDWTDANLTSLAKDASWVQTSIGLRLRPADTPGGGPGGTTGGNSPSTDCQALYEQCMQEESCTHSLVCLCCLPCVVDYAGCMRKIILKPGGGGGTTPVTTNGGTAGHNPKP